MRGSDSGITQTELNDVARLMNQRPRKTLGWRTPEEPMAEELPVFRSTVALETRIQDVPHGDRGSERLIPTQDQAMVPSSTTHLGNVGLEDRL